MLSKEKLVVERWKYTGLLSHLPEYAIEDCAFVFENQRVYNETSSNEPGFNRCSIPLCRRIMDGLRLNINVKSRLVENNKFDQWFDTRLKFDLPKQIQFDGSGDPRKVHLEIEAKYCADFARSMLTSINEYMNAAGIYDKKPFYFLGLGKKDGTVVVFHS